MRTISQNQKACLRVDRLMAEEGKTMLEACAIASVSKSVYYLHRTKPEKTVVKTYTAKNPTKRKYKKRAVPTVKAPTVSAPKVATTRMVALVGSPADVVEALRSLQ